MLGDSTSFGSMEYKDDHGVLRVSYIPMGPLIMTCSYSSMLQSYYKKREVIYQAHNCPKKQILATFSKHSASKSKQAIMGFSGVLLLLAVFTATASA